jgi:carboxyl-terminal processing protease
MAVARSCPKPIEHAFLIMNVENDDQLFGPSARTPRPALLMLLCLVVGMGAGVVFDRRALLAFVPTDAVSDFRLISEAWNTIQRYYVDRTAMRPKTLTYGAISGMVGALGDTGHSVFLSPEMVKQLKVTESGQFKGVGVEIEMKNGHVVVVAPIDNSPAQRAGLRSGDIIMSVDGRDITGLALNQVVERVTGPAGTSVKLAILDPRTRVIRSVTIIRAAIKLNNVTWQRLPGTEVADVRIAGFSDDVAKGLRKTLHEVQQQNLRGMILDLRNNPGGVLDEAVTVASQFLTNGNVLLVKDAKGKITPMPVQPGGLATNMPLVVLINGGSASAAEIVAGALRDAHRATLIGETTFGTGTVLNEFPLADGSALMLAVREWLTPNGHSFWHKGIAPELEVPLPEKAMPLIPSAERDLTAAQLQSSDDKQLLAALKYVTAGNGNRHVGARHPTRESGNPATHSANDTP